MRLAENAAGDDIGPRLSEERFGRGRLAVELGGVGLEGERVLVLPRRVVGSEDEQADGAVVTPGEENRDFVAVVEDVVVGFVPVAKGVEELAEPPALALDARLVPPLARELAAELEVVAGEGAEGFIGSPRSRARAVRRFRSLAPLRDGAPMSPVKISER